MRALVLRVQLGHRQVLLPVAVEPLRRRGERKVRAHERHEQHPRAVAPLRRLLVQPDLRARRDVAVVDACTATRRGRRAWPSCRRPCACGMSSRTSPLTSPMPSTMCIGTISSREAVVVARPAAEVQLADRDDAMPGVAQRVVPARDRAVVGVGVVPVADVVHVACRRRTPRAPARRSGRSCTPT